jgi:class 3 adenylate cyclase
VSTFLVTDVEGSTDLWARDETAMAVSLAAHNWLLRAAVESRSGYVFTTAGDSFAVAFDRASRAVEAALAAQHALTELAWPRPPSPCGWVCTSVRPTSGAETISAPR